MENEVKTEVILLIPLPNCELFQVHGSKFKPNPICNMGKTSVRCVSHTIFFFCVCKYTLYCFFSFFVKLFVLWSMANVLSKINIFAPDMLCDCLFKLFISCAYVSWGIIFTYFRIAFKFSVAVTVDCWKVQNLILGTNYTVIVFVVNIAMST